MKIARVGDFYLEIPSVRYSLFDTPYTPHMLGTAVDVYFQGEALFPLEEGRLIEIKKIRTPRYIPVNEDYLLIFKIQNFCLKVLHVEPKLKVGERVSLGDKIGNLRLSGFFSPWTDKHAHFEIRPCEDRYRARGGITLFPEIKDLVPKVKGVEFEVIEKTENYMWLKPVKTEKKRRGMTPLGNIEGGLPHYRYGGIFNGKEGEIFGIKVKAYKILENGVGIFKPSFEVIANGRKVKGFGVYCNERRIKLIGGNFEVGERVKITLKPNIP
ncbi:hypothetical protein PNA2_1867 [Pyrococcus sp. NA2]|uniref:hypothetical protein n=1 Tax=Pyrococcus sp. (strain NA2) TaxID=342949 RepID=UPI000209ACE0|nr:hypothetical protein [Pyrococcus sp. NA2]AEC52782.1 hypothetical protein PNA2_1867 [Pyrococcus sp. NA2]